MLVLVCWVIYCVSVSRLEVWGCFVVVLFNSIVLVLLDIRLVVMVLVLLVVVLVSGVLLLIVVVMFVRVCIYVDGVVEIEVLSGIS